MPPPFGQYGQHRALEILPGLLAWMIIVGTLLLALLSPLVAIVVIIAFDLYWLLRVLYFVIHVLTAYYAYRKSLKTNWTKKLAALPRADEIYHLIFLPTYQDEVSILEETLDNLTRNAYRNDRLLVVVGGEEREQAHFLSLREVLEKKYSGIFADLSFTLHPKDLPDEIPGKGSNLSFMAKEAQKMIDARGIPYAHIIVSAFDSDTLAHEEYFSCLAYHFLTVPDPLRSSYQPITLFSNNIWTASAPVRVAAFGTTFWLFSELVRPERMWTFSSHSMPWQMLVDVGFWEKDIVSEDSRIFMQAFLHYEGDYRVTPIFLPVSMDTVADGTYLKSLVALYKQQRRWAWGVEHIPYMFTRFPKHPKISRFQKIKYLFNHFEGMLSWATAPMIIFVLGYLPFLTVQNEGSALVVNAPHTLEFMMRGATLGVFVTGTMSFLLLPPRPKELPRFTWALMLLQWLLLPITFIVFGALPALDAQTRLMLGRYLGFNVTKKVAASRLKRA